jgi:hypothetical protein
VYTKDRIPVDLDLKVYYSVDLRQANPASLAQALTLSTDGWEGLVKTNATDLSRNVVVISFTFDELNSPRGRLLLKKTLSAHLSERVKNMGVQVNPRTGVNLQNVQPNEFIAQPGRLQPPNAAGRPPTLLPIMEACTCSASTARCDAPDGSLLPAVSSFHLHAPGCRNFLCFPSQHRNGLPGDKRSARCLRLEFLGCEADLATLQNLKGLRLIGEYLCPPNPRSPHPGHGLHRVHHARPARHRRPARR